VKPLLWTRLEEFYGMTPPRQRPLRNCRSGRIGLLVPARRLLTDEGERVERFELIRPLKREYLTADQLAESNWEAIERDPFRECWDAEVSEAASSLKRERIHLATGLLLPVWDKLPAEHVQVSRIAAKDGRSLLGREVPAVYVPDLFEALGLESEHRFSPDDLARLVLSSGKPLQFVGVEPLTLKRSLVNSSQRLELVGFSPARLDWYKAKGCFTEIIRYQTRLFVPVGEAAQVLKGLQP
jgi:hypothetical protein